MYPIDAIKVLNPMIPNIRRAYHRPHHHSVATPADWPVLQDADASFKPECLDSVHGRLTEHLPNSFRRGLLQPVAWHVECYCRRR